MSPDWVLQERAQIPISETVVSAGLFEKPGTLEDLQTVICNILRQMPTATTLQIGTTHPQAQHKLLISTAFWLHCLPGAPRSQNRWPHRWYDLYDLGHSYRNQIKCVEFRFWAFVCVSLWPPALDTAHLISGRDLGLYRLSGTFRDRIDIQKRTFQRLFLERGRAGQRSKPLQSALQ